VPQHNVIVRLLHAGVAREEIETYMINRPTGGGKICKSLVLIGIFGWNNIDGANQRTIVIIARNGSPGASLDQQRAAPS